MATWFGWVFSADNFMPHGHCFLWQPATLWLNVGSDALIASAYFAIPLTIYSFTRQMSAEIRYSWVPTTFAAFIETPLAHVLAPAQLAAYPRLETALGDAS